MHSFYISLPTFSPIVLTAQSLLLATVSQMVFLVNKQNIVSMHYQYVSLLCVCAFPEAVCRIFVDLYLVQKRFSPISFLLRKSAEPLVCCFSSNRLRFCLWRASKTGVKERGLRCSIRPFRQALGDHIQWIVSCSSASHKTVFRVLVIVAGEAASWKRVRHPRAVPTYNGILASCKMEMRLEIH